MKRDKVWLKVGKKPQIEVITNLVSEFCEETYVSAGDGSSFEGRDHTFNLVHDLKELEGQGPLAGILSAMELDPESAWLVVAVDLPYLNSETLRILISQRDPGQVATVYQSASDGMPEPLCAIYEKKARTALWNWVRHDKKCPRKFLIEQKVPLIVLKDKQALDNMNMPEDWERACRHVSADGGSK